jgi:predicted permease
MTAIFTTILPVFGLIALGYLAARLRYITATAAQGLTQFVFNMAIPALLFRTIVLMEQQPVSPWPLWTAMFGGLAIIWIITTLLLRNADALRGDGGAAASMCASFGNLALLGLPLSIAHFGQEVAVPVSLVLSLHAAVLWFVATAQIETVRQGHMPSWPSLIKELLGNLVRNPIVLGLLLGALWRVTGLGLNEVLDRLLEMLGNGGIPTALVALGLSLASYSLKGQWSTISILIILKMAVLPIIVWALATFAVTLPPLWIKATVLLAAMPTGANAYLFAQRYNSATAAVSGAVAVGTGVAIFTVAILLYLMDNNIV